MYESPEESRALLFTSPFKKSSGSGKENRPLKYEKSTEKVKKSYSKKLSEEEENPLPSLKNVKEMESELSWKTGIASEISNSLSEKHREIKEHSSTAKEPEIKSENEHVEKSVIQTLEPETKAPEPQTIIEDIVEAGPIQRKTSLDQQKITRKSNKEKKKKDETDKPKEQEICESAISTIPKIEQEPGNGEEIKLDNEIDHGDVTTDTMAKNTNVEPDIAPIKETIPIKTEETMNESAGELKEDQAPPILENKDEVKISEPSQVSQSIEDQVSPALENNDQEKISEPLQVSETIDDQASPVLENKDEEKINEPPQVTQPIEESIVSDLSMEHANSMGATGEDSLPDEKINEVSDSLPEKATIQNPTQIADELIHESTENLQTNIPQNENKIKTEDESIVLEADLETGNNETIESNNLSTEEPKIEDAIIVPETELEKSETNNPSENDNTSGGGVEALKIESCADPEPIVEMPETPEAVPDVNEELEIIKYE